MVLLVFVRDAAHPARVPRARVSRSCSSACASRGGSRCCSSSALPLGVAAIGLGFSLWTDAVAASTSTAVVLADRRSGRSTRGAARDRLRDRAAARRDHRALAASPASRTTGPDLVRAIVQQLRVPYRIGYTALAALPLRAAVRARARGDPPGASRARRPRRPRTVRGDRRAGRATSCRCSPAPSATPSASRSRWTPAPSAPTPTAPSATSCRGASRDTVFVVAVLGGLGRHLLALLPRGGLSH